MKLFNKNIPNRAILKDGKLVLILNERDLTMTKKLSDIRGCKYYLKKGTFEMPLRWSHVQKLAEWHFVFGRSLRDWERLERQRLEIKQLKIKDIPGLKGTLRPYQVRGVEWIDECGGRALIADEMGLGKTVQALAWCQMHIEQKPILVICPSGVKINWARETVKWCTDVNVQILEGRTPTKITGNVAIINYDIIHDWAETIKEYGFEVLISDEAHFIKNSKTKRTKGFKRIAKYIPNVIALTGTPIQSSPIELFNIVSILDPLVFPDYVEYTKKYCQGKPGMYGGWEAKGAANTQELHRKLVNSIMIRRKKSEVLTELPPKQFNVLPLRISNRREYAFAEQQFLEFLDNRFDEDLDNIEDIEKQLKAYAKKHEIDVSDDLSGSDIQTIKQTKIDKAGNAKVLVQMASLKRLAVEGKMKAVIEWIHDFLETDEKLVLFALNRIVIDMLMKEFPNAARVDGKVTGAKRQKEIDRFQNDENCKLFFGNMDAAGIGLTLTSASNVAIIQFPWTPDKLSQAIDRVHRITQLKKVNVYFMIGENTIEEKILKVLTAKEKVANDILEGGNYKGVSTAIEVLKMYKN